MWPSILILAAVSLTTALSAGPVSDTERQQLVDHLKNSQKVFADAIHGLSPAQAKFKPAPDRWSILECAEHLTQAEQLLFNDVTAALSNPAGKKSQASDADVLDVWGTRKQKAQSSGDYDPIGRWPDLSAVQKEFEARRAKTIQFVTKTQEDLRGRLCCGGMDLYQQLLGISAHTLRHVEQMNEVKAQPGYPKS
jgi:DinB superfamily